MPFIWNDEEFLFIGDDELYDEAEYHVVRKIYVELQSNSTSILQEEIEPFFTKFGPVEQIEMRHTGVRTSAYITFTHDKDACLAMSMGKTGINERIIHRILPAPTTDQPPPTARQPSATVEQSADDASTTSDEPTLLMLNDDCLLKLFEYCDLSTLANVWKVCKRTRNLLEGFVLPKHNGYEINFTMDKPKKTLKRVREELECLGPYIKKLRFAENEHVDFLTFGHNVQFYVKVCNEYFGRSLKELELYFIPIDIFSGENSLLTQPLFLEIERLSIHGTDDIEIQKPIDIHLPKLKEIKLETEFPDDLGQPTNVPLLRKKFPNLERADIRPIIPKKVMKIFLKNHKKLQYLQIDGLDSIQVIAEELKDLKELVIRFPGCMKAGKDVLLPLRKNKALIRLVIRHAFTTDNFDSLHDTNMLGHLSSLQQLRTLMVTADYDIDPKAFINLGHEIPYLEHFCSNFNWNESTIKKFIKRARHLKTFCVFNYQYDPSVDFIQALVNIRKSMFPNGSHEIIVLELIIPLREIPDIKLDTEMTRYVTVSFLEISAETRFYSDTVDAAT